MKQWLKSLEIGLEELILLFLILIEVLDFFTIIPPFLEYVEKTVAIIAMCYLFYKASMTKIVFGKKEKNIDLMIVTAYLLLSIKTVIGFLISAARETSALQGLYRTILAHADTIEKTGFWIGSIILLVTAAILVHERIRKPCLMQIMHETKKVEGAMQATIRFLLTYLVLSAIFVIVFSLAMEWLGMTVDAPILIIALLFYLFVIVKRGKGIKTESFLRKVSDASEKFYERFISLFHSRKTVGLAITGLLVLHLLVEIGHFIIPYTTGLLYPWYFQQLGPGHQPLGMRMAADFFAAGTIPAQTGVLIIYVLNVLAVLLLFFGPAYAWSRLYARKTAQTGHFMWLFFGSVSAFIMLPVFRMSKINSPMILGADITTQQIPHLQNAWMVLLISGLVMAIFHILGKKNPARTTQVALATVMIYFGIYLYHFFASLAKYYSISVGILAKSGQHFIAAHLLIYFAITILFYVGGYLLFLYHGLFKQKI
ncbi:hypothetical protein KY363_00450 [Candidatus Woesearchaeota archaeon]|nr:hypothetical protein [Candidatus Woesearchaeota archaeon]